MKHQGLKRRDTDNHASSWLEDISTILRGPRVYQIETPPNEKSKILGSGTCHVVDKHVKAIDMQMSTWAALGTGGVARASHWRRRCQLLLTFLRGVLRKLWLSGDVGIAMIVSGRVRA